MFEHANSFLSTAIYIDDIFSYYITLFLKIPSRCKYFVVLEYINFIYTVCPRSKDQNFGRVFFILIYTDISQNTYIQSW
jgi:hypothetical protein